MSEDHQELPNLVNLIDQHPLPDGVEPPLHRKKSDLAAEYRMAVKEGLRLHRAKSPGALVKIVQLGQQLRLKLGEQVDWVADQLGGGLMEPVMATRSASPSRGSSETDKVTLSVTDDIVGQVVLKAETDGTISLALSVLDLTRSPLPAFRYTLIADGHGVVAGLDRVPSGGQSVALQSIPFAKYRIILEREDGSASVTVDFGPEEEGAG